MNKDIPYIGDDRRRPPAAVTPFETHAIERFLLLEKRLAEGAAEMKNLRDDMNTNNKATKQILDIIQSGKGFFRVTGWIGGGVGRLVTLVLSAGALWNIFHHKP